jgi:phage terminase large subunit-like protein
MTDDRITLHDPQRAVLASPARFKVVACGRRWGKTELGKAAVIQRLAAGDQCVWWLAPTYQMAGQVWRDFKRHFRRTAGTRIHNSEREIEFVQGGLLAIRSAYYPDHLRGAGLDFAVLDEAAFMLPGIWQQIVRPMLLDKGGHALLISSPNGRNWFWEAYQLGLSGVPDWASFHYPSHANPLLPHDDLASIQATTVERVWRQEYLAEFVDDSGQVFRDVLAAADTQAGVYQPGHRYVAGVDWGRENDYTAIAVLDADTAALVALERFNHVGWETQRSRLAAVCHNWHVSLVIAEANSVGSPNIEALRQAGLPVTSFTMTSRSKTPLIDALALAIETRQLRLLRDETLLNELAAYTMKRSASGQWQYSAPAGTHDDTVIALALAWQAVSTPRLRLDFA